MLCSTTCWPGVPRSRKSRSKGNGGKVSNASQLVSTSRPIRDGVLVEQELADRTAGVVADQRDVAEVVRLEEATGRPGPRRAATGRRRRASPSVCEASGQVGRRCGTPRSASRSGTSAHSVSSTRNPCTNTTGGPSAGPPRGSGWCRPAGRSCGRRAWSSRSATVAYRLYVTYGQGVWKASAPRPTLGERPERRSSPPRVRCSPSRATPRSAPTRSPGPPG